MPTAPDRPTLGARVLVKSRKQIKHNGILHLSLSCGPPVLERAVEDKIDCGS